MKPRPIEIEKVELCPQKASLHGPFFQIWLSGLDGCAQPYIYDSRKVLLGLDYEIERYGDNEFRSNVRRLLKTFQPGQEVNTHWIVDKDGVHWKGGIMTTLDEPPPTSPFKNFEI